MSIQTDSDEINLPKFRTKQEQIAYYEWKSKEQKNIKQSHMKYYARMVKQGNKKAIQKAAMTKMDTAKGKKKKRVPLKDQEPNQPEIQKMKISQQQKQMIDKTIQARADRYLQQIELEKLNYKLEDERKKTKLFQLNETCKQKLMKSKKVKGSQNEPGKNKYGNEIVRKIESKVQYQIRDIDEKINQIMQQKKKLKTQNYSKEMKRKDQENPQSQIVLNSLVFEMSGEELLQMQYIPI